MLYDVETHFLIMGIFFVSLIVQSVFIVQKLLGVVTWPWWKVLCIFEFYGHEAEVLVRFCLVK
jgi:hypothetical protein